MFVFIHGQYFNYLLSYFKGVWGLDLEDSTVNNAGIRFAVQNDMAIGINRDKLMDKNALIYTETKIPMNRWFTFNTEILIGEEGHYKMWIEGTKIMDRDGLSFINELNFYDSVMVGITGTRANKPSHIKVDDFSIIIERGT